MQSEPSILFVLKNCTRENLKSQLTNRVDLVHKILGDLSYFELNRKY